MRDAYVRADASCSELITNYLHVGKGGSCEVGVSGLLHQEILLDVTFPAILRTKTLAASVRYPYPADLCIVSLALRASSRMKANAVPTSAITVKTAGRFFGTTRQHDGASLLRAETCLHMFGFDPRDVKSARYNLFLSTCVGLLQMGHTNQMDSQGEGRKTSRHDVPTIN